MCIKIVADALPTKQDAPAITFSIYKAISGLHSSSLQGGHSSLNSRQLRRYSLKSYFMTAHKVGEGLLLAPSIIHEASQGTLKSARRCIASFLHK